MPPRPKSKRTASLPVIVKHDKQPATRPIMLLVLGPHRSGTSLTTRLLECLGAKNAELQLGAGGNDNPRGFFEAIEVLEFNDTVLSPRLQWHWSGICPVDWTVLNKVERSRLGLKALEIIRRNYPLSNPVSVLKEPRINNILPFWLSLLEHAGFDVRFVCSVRDPVSVARSLVKRDGLSIPHSSMIYLNAWLSVLPHLQEQQVSFVQFDEIFATPGKILAKVADKLGLPPPPDFDQRVHAFTSEHLDPSLRHSTLPREDVILEPDLPHLVAELYRVLLDAAQSQNIRKTAKFLAYAERQIESLAPLLADYDAKQTRLASLQTESQAAQAECARLQAQLEVSAQQNYAALVADRDAIAARLSSLELAHTDLVTRHTSLVTESEALRSDHSSLIAERDDLATRHSSLATALEQLQAQHSALVAERDDLAARHHLLATELEALRAEHSDLLTRHSTLVTSHNDFAARLTSLEDERAALAAATAAEREAKSKVEEQLKDTAEENELLLSQLHQVQEELEKYFLENRELKQQHDHLAADHSSLVAERDDLATRHSSLATDLEQLKAQHSSLIAERTALLNERAALAAKLSDLSTSGAIDSSRLRQYINDTATLARKLVACEDIAKSWQSASTITKIAEITRTHAHISGDHKHLNYTLDGISCLGRHFLRVEARIVEHLGNPGFGVLQQNAAESPFYSWREDGTENGRGYMLIIPADKKGLDWLSHAATADLLLLRDIVSHIKAHLLLHQDAYWLNVCSELLHSLALLPPRIHYDSLELVSVSKRITRALLINPSHRMTLFPNHIVTFDKSTITHIDVENSPFDALERACLSQRSLLQIYKPEARALLRAINQFATPTLRLPNKD